ncbi:MAG: hypothetical protein V2J08_04020 [Desulfotignum sp.]|nr:hypothetical protein [Desulfotignum sp.]
MSRLPAVTKNKDIFRYQIALGLVSAAVIGFQLALMWYFSNTQWNHFAFMVISVALLGFGASGTFITVCRPWIMKHSNHVIAGAMLCSAFFMTISISLCQWAPFRLDAMLLFSHPVHVFRLSATYLVLFIPFFCSGLAIGLILINNVEKIGGFYFVNLVGSGLGGMGTLFFFWIFSPSELPGAMAILPVAAAIVFGQQHRVLHIFTLVVLGVMMFFFIVPPALQVSEYKGIRKTMQLPKARTIHAQPTPFGFIQVVSSPVLRHAPGVSLQFDQKIPRVDAFFVNGEWLGPVFDIQQQRLSGGRHILDFSPMGLAFRIQDPETILCLSSGTGSLVSQAVSHGPDHITALEKNPVIPELMHALYGAASVYSHPKVSVVPKDDYTYLVSSRQNHDLIVLPVLDAFGGSSGLYALNEQYHLTQQAFALMWERLSDNGMISVAAWLDYPVRTPLRLVATLVSMLESNGIDHLENHIVAVRSWNMVGFVVKKSVFTPQQTTLVREFALEMNFDPLLLPDIGKAERIRFNKLQDQDFFTFVDRLMGDTKADFIRRYEFNIAPAVENKPYFSQFLKLAHLRDLKEFFSTASIPFLELGYLLLMMTFIQVSIFAVVLIVLPLVVRRWEGSHKWWTAVYFAALGLGFMGIEMVLIQRFVLYFGNPLYAAAAVISGVLIFSGVGSYLSSRLSSSRRTIMGCLLFIVAGALVYMFVLTPLLQQTIDLAFPVKIVFGLFFIAPLSLLMGMPFPLGLRLARRTNPLNISWAWAINGCCSVISVVLATIIAIEFGFVAVMAAGAGMYGTAWTATVLMSPK